MERKLASIQTVEKLDPIPGADRIELARVLGWSLIVKKGEFKEGDACVFFEIDSLLPSDNPDFAFMEKTKFRVKTMKMKGVISQGLALPTSILGDGAWTLQADVSERLGVTKWEPPENQRISMAAGHTRANFPFWVPKTDEIRLQSVMGVLDELKGKQWFATIKYDGSSATYTMAPENYADEYGRFHVCTRNRSLKYSEKSWWWKLAEKYKIESILADEEYKYAIQGEVCGPGLQKNTAGLADVDLLVFDVFCVMEQRYLNYVEYVRFCDSNGLRRVNRVIEGEAFDESLESLTELSNITYPGTNHGIEGIVVRPQTEMMSSSIGGRMSFKVINPYYLLSIDG